jgi:hypothetical protein
MPPKYSLPSSLAGIVPEAVYRRWLQRKAQAHCARDKKRGYKSASVSTYKAAIHGAVEASGGRDHYTGELMDWTLISKYQNSESKLHRHKYKAKFALLPTVDHLLAGHDSGEFVICAWRTNDAKNDLSAAEFIALCRRVVDYAEGPRGP